MSGVCWPAEAPDGLIGCAEHAHAPGCLSTDEQVALVSSVVERIAADRTITRVAELAEQIGVSQQTLQRLFGQYVGVSPKWVIQRYRLIEAADQLAQRADIDLPGLAQALGYFDQAHFINDFRATVGDTPAAYAETVSGITSKITVRL